MHLVIRSKKVKIWHRKFTPISNARIIRASKLVIRMGKFNTNYNPTKIDNDFKASEPDNTDTEIESNDVTLWASKISNFETDFDKICNPCIWSKQMRIVK